MQHASFPERTGCGVSRFVSGDKQVRLKDRDSLLYGNLDFRKLSTRNSNNPGIKRLSISCDHSILYSKALLASSRAQLLCISDYKYTFHTPCLRRTPMDL